MRYGLAFGYFLRKRDWVTNLLLLTVCEFIPVVGPIVALGYRAEVAVALDRDPDQRRHPNFDFGRFVEYLTRGVWPFLVGLVLGLGFLVPVLGGVAVGIAVAAAANQPVAGLAVGGALFVASLVGLVMLSVPMTLHAELTNRFDLGGGFRFAVSFWTLVGGPAFLTGLVYIPLSIGVAVAGLLCCFVGIYPANVINQMAAQHLMVQLYREYLDRGGDPLAEYDPRDDEDDGRWEEEDDDRREGSDRGRREDYDSD
jgi:hypothetical protein